MFIVLEEGLPAAPARRPWWWSFVARVLAATPRTKEASR